MTGQQIHTSLGLSSVSGASGMSSAASAGNGVNGAMSLTGTNVRINSGSGGAGVGGLKSGLVGGNQANRGQMAALQNMRQAPGRQNNQSG